MSELPDSASFTLRVVGTESGRAYDFKQCLDKNGHLSVNQWKHFLRTQTNSQLVELRHYLMQKAAETSQQLKRLLDDDVASSDIIGDAICEQLEPPLQSHARFVLPSFLLNIREGLEGVIQQGRSTNQNISITISTTKPSHDHRFKNLRKTNNLLTVIDEMNLPLGKKPIKYIRSLAAELAGILEINASLEQVYPPSTPGGGRSA